MDKKSSLLKGTKTIDPTAPLRSKKRPKTVMLCSSDADDNRSGGHLFDSMVFDQFVVIFAPKSHISVHSSSFTIKRTLNLALNNMRLPR